jgi:adenylyl cyclase-associated protein
MRDASQSYGNRVVRKYKDRYPPPPLIDELRLSGDTLHKEWDSAFIDLLNELAKYVRKHFPQGIKWNPEGAPAESFIGTSSPNSVASPAPSGSAIPPPVSTPSPGAAPPPPPPPPPPESLMAARGPAEPAAGKATTMGAVFSQINQGEGITGALKHVDKSQMTHKNPSLRETKKSPQLPPKPASLKRNTSGSSVTTVPKSGKKTLEGTKWVIVCTPWCSWLMEGKL